MHLNVFFFAFLQLQLKVQKNIFLIKTDDIAQLFSTYKVLIKCAFYIDELYSG